ncbi:unnamed protein product, partial [Symbiodinium sp. KB8]
AGSLRSALRERGTPANLFEERNDDWKNYGDSWDDLPVPSWVPRSLFYRDGDGVERVEIAQLEKSQHVMTEGVDLQSTVKEMIKTMESGGYLGQPGQQAWLRGAEAEPRAIVGLTPTLFATLRLRLALVEDDPVRPSLGLVHPCLVGKGSKADGLLKQIVETCRKKTQDATPVSLFGEESRSLPRVVSTSIHVKIAVDYSAVVASDAATFLQSSFLLLGGCDEEPHALKNGTRAACARASSSVTVTALCAYDLDLEKDRCIVVDGERFVEGRIAALLQHAVF